jgi:hypothetical protein
VASSKFPQSLPLLFDFSTQRERAFTCEFNVQKLLSISRINPFASGTMMSARPDANLIIG